MRKLLVACLFVVGCAQPMPTLDELDEADAVYSRFLVNAALLTENGMELVVQNTTRFKIAKARFSYIIIRGGVPEFEGEFTYVPPGGIQDGETQRWVVNRSGYGQESEYGYVPGTTIKLRVVQLHTAHRPLAVGLDSTQFNRLLARRGHRKLDYYQPRVEAEYEEEATPEVVYTNERPRDEQLRYATPEPSFPEPEPTRTTVNPIPAPFVPEPEPEEPKRTHVVIEGTPIYFNRLLPQRIRPVSNGLTVTQSNGTPAIVSKLDFGRLDGNAVVYHANGQPMLEGQYRKGTRHGFFSIYDPAGKAEFTSQYSNGTILDYCLWENELPYLIRHEEKLHLLVDEETAEYRTATEESAKTTPEFEKALAELEVFLDDVKQTEVAAKKMVKEIDEERRWNLAKANSVAARKRIQQRISQRAAQRATDIASIRRLFVGGVPANSGCSSPAQRHCCRKNQTWVNGYVRSDGTYVRGHWRNLN